jgi:hypothetical protein
MGRKSPLLGTVDPPGSRQPSRPYCSIRLLPRPLTGVFTTDMLPRLDRRPEVLRAQEHRRGDTGLVQRPRDKRGEIARALLESRAVLARIGRDATMMRPCCVLD